MTIVLPVSDRATLLMALEAMKISTRMRLQMGSQIDHGWWTVTDVVIGEPDEPSMVTYTQYEEEA